MRLNVIVNIRQKCLMQFNLIEQKSLLCSSEGNIVKTVSDLHKQFQTGISMEDTGHHHARAIGEKLRAVRQEQKMSLRDLAEKAEISASMLSQIETGKAFPSV